MKIINALMPILAPIIGLFGVWLGSVLSKRNSIKLEKQFYITKIRIEKNQEITKDLYEIMRIVGRTQINFYRYLYDGHDPRKFSINNDKLQDTATYLHRSLLTNAVFMEDSLKSDYEQFYKKYGVICSKIYEKYHFSNTPNRHFTDEELESEIIRNDFINCMLHCSDIIDRMTYNLNVSLKGLE